VHHEYSLLTIAAWLIFWISQSVRRWVPDWIIRPEKVDRTPPTWWYSFSTWYHWWYCVDSDGTVRDCWYENYRDVVVEALISWIDEVADHAEDTAADFTRSITGYVQHGYASFEHWTNAIRNRVGTWVPSFATDLAGGLYATWRMLPAAVRVYGHTWQEIWDGLAEGFRGWVRNNYDGARALATISYEWIVSVGADLKVWYELNHADVDSFLYNPNAWLHDRLGSAWSQMFRVGQDFGSELYNLLSEHRQQIHDFFDDPLWWLYSRAEDFLCEQW